MAMSTLNSYSSFVKQMLDPSLTTREVGWLLGVEPDTVCGYLRQGEMDGFRLPGGRMWRVRLSSVVEFMEAGTDLRV